MSKTVKVHCDLRELGPGVVTRASLVIEAENADDLKSMHNLFASERKVFDTNLVDGKLQVVLFDTTLEKFGNSEDLFKKYRFKKEAIQMLSTCTLNHRIVWN